MNKLETWIQAGLHDQPVSYEDAGRILRDTTLDPLLLIQAAGKVREHYQQRTVSIHILNNVKNGACPEDCGYCGQAHDSDAPVQAYKSKTRDEIIAEAKEAKESGAFRYCMAMSGRGPKDRDIDLMVDVIREVTAMGLKTCLSAGLLDDEKAARLKDAGLDRFNHNLNTSESHYKHICSTHTYADRIETLQAARSAGLGLCSGMIVGMGETREDLLQVAFRLRELKAESIPVNFLLPIEGNKVNSPLLEGKPLEPWDVLRVLCMFRFVNPSAEIRIAAGREYHLRSLQALALWPASSLFMDGYLLSKGSDAEDTLRMIKEAGFTPAWPEGSPPETLQHYFEDQTKIPAVEKISMPTSQITTDLINVQGLKPAVRKQAKADPNFVPVSAVSSPQQDA